MLRMLVHHSTTPLFVKEMLAALSSPWTQKYLRDILGGRRSTPPSTDRALWRAGVEERVSSSLDSVYQMHQRTSSFHYRWVVLDHVYVGPL